MTDKNRFSDSICVIIRSAGERTEQLCKELVLEQGIPEKDIRLVNEVPFTRAVQKSYQVGIEMGCRWTLCLDADVLLLPGSIRDMVKLAEQQESSLFEIQCLVIDKFMGGPREAGNHLYRTSLLEKALPLIPVDENIIRPETHTLNAMSSLGFPRKRINYLAGIHDFEQYYRDIFRKCFIQAHKHQDYAEIFLTYWPQQSASDADFQVAIKGFAEGIQYQGGVRIDIHQEVYQQRFTALRITEKQELNPGSLQFSDIQALAESWQVPAVYRKYFHYGLIKPGQKNSYLKKLNKRLPEITKELGMFKLPGYLIGAGIEKLGKKIKQWVAPDGAP
jgi:hypothetical protein